MTTQEAIRLEDQYQIPTYAKMEIALVRGEGSYVFDVDGTRYLDFYGGHCVTLIGHSPPRVVEAIRRQAGELLFYSNAAYSPVRATAARMLAEMAPEGLRHVFFCNSGAEANETALKLARKATGKTRVIAMEGGFHGRTLGSLAVTWKEAYRSPYQHALSPTTFVPFGSAEAVDHALVASGDTAAVILEPIQSMAGITTADASYYRDLRSICDRYGVMLIFDEVQTGVGRTGTFSISEQFGMRPDLITLAKSLGSGVPVGAVLVSDELAATVQSGDQGTTFGGGMLAMAAVAATLETLQEDRLMLQAPRLFGRIRDAASEGTRGVRGLGALIGIELERAATPVRRHLLENGILTGSADDPNVIRLMPPLNTPDEAIDAFASAFQEALAATSV